MSEYGRVLVGMGSLLSGDESANKTRELPGSKGQMHM